jgi:hypothetical protein
MKNDEILGSVSYLILSIITHIQQPHRVTADTLTSLVHGDENFVGSGRNHCTYLILLTLMCYDPSDETTYTANVGLLQLCFQSNRASLLRSWINWKCLFLKQSTNSFLVSDISLYIDCLLILSA